MTEGLQSSSPPASPSAFAAASPLLEARELSVSFGRRQALSGVNLRTHRGELVGIVGSPDAGKSTLFKSLCLLVAPSSGEVLFDGQDLGRLRRSELLKQQARFGFAFQKLGLFDRKSALSNVAFPLLRGGLDRDSARARAQEALRSVGLAGSEGKLPHELSGGMRRRLALARAMVTRPDVALLDDPFVGLDPVACARIAALIVNAHRANGGVTLVAASDPTPLFAVADRLILMKQGKFLVDLPASSFASNSHPAIAAYLRGHSSK